MQRYKKFFLHKNKITSIRGFFENAYITIFKMVHKYDRFENRQTSLVYDYRKS